MAEEANQAGLTGCEDADWLKKRSGPGLGASAVETCGRKREGGSSAPCGRRTGRAVEGGTQNLLGVWRGSRGGALR